MQAGSFLVHEDQHAGHDGKHTALHDIQQAIEEMRYLRGKVFK